GRTAARAGPRPAGFTGGFGVDFAEEFDTAVRGDGGTARAAETVRAGRAMGCGGAGSATIRWCPASTSAARKPSVGHDLADSRVGRGLQSAREGERIEDDLEPERLVVAGNTRFFQRMVDPHEPTQRVGRPELQGGGEAVGR